VRHSQPSDAHETALAAYRTVSLASGWYLRSARCLPRAAATSILLRTRGIQSVVVLGVRTTPFAGHAWVEVDGKAVGEDPWELGRYAELTRIPVTP
jgi:hypothetical protein